MLRIGVRFPLGIYHALSAESFDRPEWPPSPVRLVGALLAATHESEAIDTKVGRNVLEILCAATPPELVAPPALPFSDEGADGVATIAEVRGASRWAPRNEETSELKKKGVSFRNIAGDRREVFKCGVVIGDQVIEVRWPGLDLDDQQVATLRAMAEEVTFLGTSRSPVILEVETDGPTECAAPVWRPAPDEAFEATEVRVPIPSLIKSFDQRHDSRKATGKNPVERSAHIPNTAMGATVPYMLVDRYEALIAGRPVDPEQWGDIIILELDGLESDLRPGASASYLVARAFRSALLSGYGPAGSPEEAPAVLRGHGSEPHAAIVPLPHVGIVASDPAGSTGTGSRAKRIAADGLIRGIAIVMPHETRVPSVLEQRVRVENGLRRFVLDDREAINLPGAGRILLRLTPPNRAPLKTLLESRYRKPSRVWQTVTPVVHARRRTSTGPRGVARQIAADCQHAGLPEPKGIEVLNHAPFAGAPDMPLSVQSIPPAWRSSLDGPRSHLRLTFGREISGPVLLGRARHFGLGLCLPTPERDLDAIEVTAIAERGDSAGRKETA